MTRDPVTDGGFGLYVHWPFCEAKCPYCDFNSHVERDVDHPRWARALLADLEAQAAPHRGRRLDSVFFGGGTPSRMDPAAVAAIVDAARRHFDAAPDLEVSLEANPTSVEAGRFAAFRDAGVGRVSVGLQSLRDDDLRRLGRTHDAAQGRAAYDMARATFPRASMDLIYARQDQTPDAWAAELDEALSMDPDHLSLYQLTIEDGTVFRRRLDAGRLPGLPDEDRLADLYLATNARLRGADRPAYEVSNHARPGAECRHNLTYWRAGDWLGVGPGAHGRHGTGPARLSTAAHRDPATWLDAVDRKGDGLDRTARGGPTDHAEEYLLTALRLSDGLDLRRLAHLGLTLDAETGPLEADGLVTRTGARIRPTVNGMAVADALIAYFVNRVSPAWDSASHSSSSSVRSA